MNHLMSHQMSVASLDESPGESPDESPGESPDESPGESPDECGKLSLPYETNLS